MNILIYLDLDPKEYISVKKSTTIRSIKSFLKKYHGDKIQFFPNNETETKVFDTNKYDDLALKSIWDQMNNPVIYISTNQIKILPEDLPEDLNFQLMEMDDKTLLNFCKTDTQKDINGVLYCDNENFWRNRLREKYGDFYPQENQTWKNLYMKLVYYLDKRGRGKSNKNPFIKAVENGELELVKYLISLPKEYGINPSADDNLAIVTAGDNGHLDIVKYLMSLPKEYKIDPSAKNNATIRYASEEGRLEVVKYLISLPKEYGIDPSADDNFAIKWASQNNRLEVVKYLISLPKEYGIDPSAENNEAIKWANRKNHLEIVKYLLSLPKKYKVHL